MKSSFIDKILERLDQLSSRQLEMIMDRLVRDRGFLEQVLEALEEGVILFDRNEMASYVNAAALKMFELRDQVCVGKSLSELLPGMDWKLFDPSGQSVVSQDLEVFYPRHRFLNVYSAPIRERTNKKKNLIFTGRVLLIRDITSQREETEQSLESERFNALTLLAAGVAHEIGNPLNSLGIQLQLLTRKLNTLEGELEVQRIQRHVVKCQEEVERLDLILKDFLHAIRPTIPQRSPVNLNTVTLKCIEKMELELKNRNSEIRLDLSKFMPELALDQGQIHQAIYNVVRNASQSMSSLGGEILVRTDVSEYEVCIEVSDKGSGISPEEMGRMYEPFQSSKKENGTGLGLLIVRRIVREHGGEIKIESQLGEGTSVCFFFPREDKRLRFLPSEGQVVEYCSEKNEVIL